MAAKRLHPCWQGKVRAPIVGPTADQAWSVLKDFCGLHQWVPTVATCYKVEGEDGRLDCVRYCAGPMNRSSAPNQDGKQVAPGWAKEKLTAFDPVARTYSYEIVETNKGFGRYGATFGVVPAALEVDSEKDSGKPKCTLEWSFEADPIEGWTEDGFVRYLGVLAEAVAKRVEEHFGC